MKCRAFPFFVLNALVLFAVFATALGVSAQSQPGLTLRITAGTARLTATGEVGSPLTLQYATNISPAAWFTFSNHTLLTSPAFITDPTTVTNRRFFRAIIQVPTNMSWIPAGVFSMGSPTNELERSTDETQHSVTLTKGFFMSKYLVTQGQYLALMSTNPSYFTPSNGFALDLTRPVEQVSWSDATNYCGQLTQQERAAGRIFTNWSYRLPTEAEWEYACRAGTTTPFYYGNDLTSGMANFNGPYEYFGGTGTVFNSGGVFLNRTTSVGSYAPNSRGLYDMAGNVWEWCQDWFGAYGSGPVSDPQGPVTGTARVFRGGAFNVTGRECRSAERSSYNPSQAFNTVGFRVVLSAP